MRPRNEAAAAIFVLSILIYRSYFQLIKSPPTMWWWRIIVFAESARRRRYLFLLSLKNSYSDYFQVFTVCMLALGNLPGNFFGGFSSFSNKIQDGRQNAMVHARAQTASSICFMFGLKEIPYPGRELKSFWCDFDNRNLDFFTFFILADISVLLILAIIKIW